MNTTKRRDFIKTVGMGGTALALGACTTGSEDNVDSEQAESAKAKIGIQQWSIRHEIEKDLSGSLAKLADIGFAGIETAFWPEGVSLTQAAKALETAGLPVLAIHCEIPLGEEKNRFLEMADAYQCKKMVWHGWPEDERYGSVEGTLELANIYNEASAFAQEHGLSFGLHNHWWEFRALEDSYAFNILLEKLDPAIFFEIDTYWAKLAGKDPARAISKWGKRAPLLHIKDGEAKDTEAPMSILGQGVQDFKAIAEAGKDTVEWFIVEFDAFDGDIFHALSQSYSYLSSNGFAEGKV